MKLKKIILENFRSYKERITLDVSDFTTLIGKNDIGKSTILEALEIYFNNNLVKIDNSDCCVYSTSKEVRIGCVFDDFNSKVLLDSSVYTSLDKEFLLNSEGLLEIHKVYDCSIKSPRTSVFAICEHPTLTAASDLLQLKIGELKKRFNDFSLDDTNVDLRSSSSIRHAIYTQMKFQLKLSYREVPLNKEDAKSVWENLESQLPIYSLFQADRPSRDEDSEVQDPMKLAISEAIKAVDDELSLITDRVRQRVEEVATRTLHELRTIDGTLANELSPIFKSEPKWDNIFKMSLTGDNDIPINKRGSGVRRLILLSFFKAEVERKRNQTSIPVIYAIEEPETSQHPNNQLLIIRSLLELSDQENCQVLITTHVPALASQLPIESIRYISKNESGNKMIRSYDEHILTEVAQSLGVFPTQINTPILFCVEGPNDINFFKNISKILHSYDPLVPDLSTDTRIAVLPLGGSTLGEWVKHQYLKNLGIPEFHIYDRDNPPPVSAKYQSAADQINQRTDGSIAFITNKRELENYIHPTAIREVMGIDVVFGDFDDLPKMVSELAGMNESTTKKWLNNKVTSQMTYSQLCEIDPQEEIKSWLIELARRLNQYSSPLLLVAPAKEGE
jgi:putative ATP-dependent endonuclease of OLD family